MLNLFTYQVIVHLQHSAGSVSESVKAAENALIGRFLHYGRSACGHEDCQAGDEQTAAA